MAEKRWQVTTGDCLELLKTLADCSVDSIVTDPPYGIKFMNRAWDHSVPSVDVWRECLRVLKPGGHLLAFAGTRTQHRMACAIEDAGFEIRDMIAWVYGSGFPKSLDVSKAIDKAAGAEREVVATRKQRGRPKSHDDEFQKNTSASPIEIITAPATSAARQWAGWGTALKPALEPITVARKPLIGTVAENVLEHGTGALNIDRCRVGTEDMSSQWDRAWSENSGEMGARYPQSGRVAGKSVPPGRWPANLIHDGSDEVVGLLGEAARFFYVPKASKADRDEGCERMEERKAGSLNMRTDSHSERNGMTTAARRNNHPTVKPTALMRYLVRLVTPPGGIVLDPFAGSGSTGRGATLEGFCFLGFELDPHYAEIARLRIGAAAKEVRQPELFP